MQIKINQDRIAKALNYVSKAVSAKPNIPVLSNVLLSVNKDKLQLSATNLDMGINMWIAGITESDGKVTASGKFLADFINAAGGERVDISLENDNLHVKTDTSKAQFQTIPASEFPILPKAEGDPFMTMKSADLITAMDKVLFACATDVTTSKIQFTGVLFELEESKTDKVTLVGLNGYQLSRKVVPITRQDEAAHQLIIPARSMQEMIKVLAAEDAEDVEIYLSGSKSQVIFKFNDIEFSVRLLEGPYPDYKGAIPNGFAYSFDVNKQEFDKALKIVNTFARTLMGNKVNLDLDLETGSLVMHTEVADLGRNETKLEVQNATGSSDLKDAYSLQFLMNMVNHMSGDTVHFETNAPLAAAVFTDKGDKNFIHLIMPVQRDD